MGIEDMPDAAVSVQSSRVRTSPGVRVALRAAIVALFAGMLVGQVVILPLLAADVARGAPEFAYLHYPVLGCAIATMVGPQVVLVATWRLVSLIRDDQIFTPAAFAWVRAMIVASFATIVPFVGIFAASCDTDGPPLLPVACLAGVIGAFAVGLVLLVLRGLLRQAVAMRDELRDVI